MLASIPKRSRAAARREERLEQERLDRDSHLPSTSGGRRLTRAEREPIGLGQLRHFCRIDRQCPERSFEKGIDWTSRCCVKYSTLAKTRMTVLGRIILVGRTAIPDGSFVLGKLPHSTPLAAAGTS